MYFHSAILVHFRPFINLSIVGSSVSPQSICLEASKNISSLVKSYKHLYGLRRVPLFLPYLIMTAELAIRANSREVATQSPSYSHSSDNISYLTELSLSYPFAKRALEICDFLRDRWAFDAETTQRDQQIQDYSTREKHNNNRTGFMMPGNHIQTFFWPYDQDRTFEKWTSGPCSNEDISTYTIHAGVLGIPSFLLQTNPLKKILPEPPRDTDSEDNREESLRNALKAHGLVLYEQPRLKTQ